MSSIYILKKSRWIPWGYEQYPQDSFSIFKYLFQMAHGNEQIMICREESNLYYAYVLKLANGERVGVGFVSDKISNDYYTLLKTFRSILKQLSDEELVIVKNSKLKLVLSKESFKEKHVNLDIFIRTHKLSINGESIPVAEIDVPKDDVVRCELGKKSSSWIVEQIKVGYHKVFISIGTSSPKTFDIRILGKIFGSVLAILLLIFGLNFMLQYCSNNVTNKNVTIRVADNKVEEITESQMMRVDDVFSDAVKRKDTSVLKFLVKDGAYDKAIVPLVNIYLAEGKEDAALRYAKMADTTKDIEARNIIKDIIFRKVGILDTQIKDIVDNLSHDVIGRFEQLVEAKRLQDSIRIIAEPVAVTYSVNKTLVSKIDEDFNVWVETGDNSPILSVKKSCYMNALRLKEDDNIHKKLNDLR